MSLKNTLLEIAIKLRETGLTIVRADGDGVFANVSLVDVYGTSSFQLSLTKKAAQEPEKSSNDHARSS